VIFVEGLHAFEQTYRDILHALRHSHPGTVIAIEDTISCDVFSTSRSLEDCVAMRYSLTGVADSSWLVGLSYLWRSMSGVIRIPVQLF
jgi:hypothetical protein